MRTNRQRIQSCLQGLLITMLLVSSTVSAETVMTPRDKAAFEAELRALNEKYGPKAGAMESGASAISEADVAPSATEIRQSVLIETPVQSVAPPTTDEGEQAAQSALLNAQANQRLNGSDNNAALTKLRIELSPKNTREFVFDGQSYTQDNLLPILQALQQKHVLDYVVLLQADSKPVQLTHIVELAKISRALRTPAVYQDGEQLRAVDAR